MVENNLHSNARVIVVGVPGVGKTSVVTNAAERLNQSQSTTQVMVFGSIMLDEAKKLGIIDRDEMRKLSINTQRQLQEMAANSISGVRSVNIIIDTHLFINTIEGRYPGVPRNLLDILSPTHLIMISAAPEEIFARRMDDGTRNRDLISMDSIKNDLEVATIMIATSSVLTGAPFKIIFNHKDKLDDAVNELVDVISTKSERK
ncbi:MAG TPA: adenylate kinase [Nitrososphaeraceae archaeon]|nr:adenylate kinase [Nitrososphaeraceae archaeon]